MFIEVHEVGRIERDGNRMCLIYLLKTESGWRMTDSDMIQQKSLKSCEFEMF